MDAEKLEPETRRLQLEIERLRANWESFLRRAFLFLFYQALVCFVLAYVFSVQSYTIVFVAIAALIWKAGEGFKIQRDLKKAKNSLYDWRETIDLANQVSEQSAPTGEIL